jgi:hypothetical protein
MSKSSDTHDDLALYSKALDSWGEAVQAHRMAPPDDGFAERLAALAKAAGKLAQASYGAHEAGYDSVPDPSPSEAPYELRPGTGRRGPEELWERFDQAVAQLQQANKGEDMLNVARAYDQLAGAAKSLADATLLEDSQHSQRKRASASRARRSA